jgi:hypothetical protein
LQLNPSYETASTIKDLVNEGKLHPLCAKIFRSEGGEPLRLYRHQQEAIEKALNRKHFIVTSGTGSGETLTYFVPIFHNILHTNPEEAKTRAIIVYPMNALVNSQEEALRRLITQYKNLTGKECPVRFSKYTGQEKGQDKQNIQKNPPHILLTNYVMLELMLIRPEEHNFVDRTTADLQFLVIDELHTYRGRQGADVGLLIRRLRERSGNQNLQCMGTSATMVAGKTTPKKERQEGVAQFASKIFGVTVEPDNIIEESLKRITSNPGIPSADILRETFNSPVPQTADEMIKNPLTAWIELTFGIEEEPEGQLRRKPPVSLSEGAQKLSGLTGIEVQHCEERLRESFLLGSQIKMADGSSPFAFKLHQFVGQGRTVYATLSATIIEFPPELYQSGMSILGYFGTILRKKYPDKSIKVRIEQNELEVKMIIESPEGDKEEVEKTLYQYGQVIKGQLAPNDFYDNRLDVIELKQQLEIAKLQLETQKDLFYLKEEEIRRTTERIRFLEEQFEKLQGLLGNTLFYSANQSENWAKLIGQVRGQNNVIIEQALCILRNIVEKGITPFDEKPVKEALEIIKKDRPEMFKHVIDLLKGSVSGVAGNILYYWILPIIGALPK